MHICAYHSFLIIIDAFLDLPQPPLQPIKKITYLVTILSVSEAKKKPVQRNTAAHRLELPSDEPWDTVKAQLLQKISVVLSPTELDFDNYKISFKIPHLLPLPTSLASDDDYKFMLKQATKGTSDSNAHIEIEEKKVKKVSVICTSAADNNCDVISIQVTTSSKRGKENLITKVPADHESEDSAASGSDDEPRKKKQKTVSLLLQDKI